MIHKQGAGFWVQPHTLRDEAITEANQYCAKTNKKAQILKQEMLPQIQFGFPGGPRFPQAEVQFTCLNSDGTVGAALNTQTCVAEIKKNPSLAPIANKVALGSAEEQTFSQLADTTKASEDEKSAIRLWSELSDSCFKQIKKQFVYVSAPPTIQALRESTYTLFTNARVALYNGEVTYGQFAQFRKGIIDNNAIAEAQIKTELAKQNAEAEARAQEISLQAQSVNLQFMQTRLMGVQTANQSTMVRQQQQIINQNNYLNNKTYNTSCNRSGYNVSCTTY